MVSTLLSRPDFLPVRPTVLTSVVVASGQPADRPPSPSDRPALTGHFIDHTGRIEPSLASTRTPWHEIDCDEPPPTAPVVRGRFSWARALASLHRTARECGQLLLHTADDQAHLWFAGIGDPDHVFVELKSLGTETLRTAATLFRLSAAESLLDHLFTGADAAELARHFPSPAPTIGPLDDLPALAVVD